MNKQKFVDFIRKPKTLTLPDLEELKGIVEEYPYFQNARAILAKGSKLNQLPDADKRIANASVYAPDRAFLKKYLTDEIIFLRPLKVTESVSEELKEKPQQPPKPEIVVPKVASKAQEPTAESVMEKPIKAPQAQGAPVSPIVEKAAPELPTKPAPNQAVQTVAKEVPVRPEPTLEEKKLQAPVPGRIDDLIAELQHDIEELHKSKARFLEIEKRIEEEDAVSKALQKVDAKSNEKKPKEPTSEKKKTLKKESEEEVSVPDKNLKAAIIEEFLINKPAMPVNVPGKEPEKSTYDLSADSGKFNPEVASEYLAEIFLEQGRKDRAIEIYKTLILKFPDKSVYFADLIKKLDS